MQQYTEYGARGDQRELVPKALALESTKNSDRISH